MSAPRITQRLIMQRSLAAMQLSLSRVQDSQEKLSTGRQINRPSDSPTGTSEAMRLRAQMAAETQYSRNAQDGSSWLGTADSTLTGMLDEVTRARDLLVQASSTGSNDATSQQAIATELGQIRESLLSSANTQLLGRPIFGGTTGSPTAYDPTGTFLGDTNPVTRTVGDGVTVRVDISGPEVFSVNGDDLFTVLGDATQALTSGGNPSSMLSRLDAVFTQMKTGLADIGARENRIDQATDRLSSSAIDNTSALSNIENVDIASAITDLQMQQVAYQASLGATARVIQPSLLDFLR
ncbi:MAG: flagellar hook-associated protein FlgL [Nocardioidaceae bacterium]